MILALYSHIKPFSDPLDTIPYIHYDNGLIQKTSGIASNRHWHLNLHGNRFHQRKVIIVSIF